jgi:hypothetical protein
MPTIVEMAHGNNDSQKRAQSFVERLAHGSPEETRAGEIATYLTGGKVPGGEDDKKRGATSLGKIAGRTVGPQAGPHKGKKS